MQTVSQTAKAILELGSRLGVSISCSNGLTITENDMIQGSFSIDRNSVSGDVIEIGNAETTELLFTLDNHDGRFDSYSFAGETLTVDIMIGTEPLRAGVFTIDNSPQKLHSMKISALDNMAKFNKKYVPGTASTLGQLLVYCCNQCGVTLNTTTFTNSAQACNQPTSETTYHQVVAWIAELAGKNAYIGHNGELYLGWYGSTKQPITSNHRFDFEVDEEDITITGVGHDDGENTTVVGTSDYALIIKGNDLVGDNISTILNNIYNVIGGYTYRPYSFSIMPMPYLWPMDEIEITMPDDSIVNSIITSHNFTLNGRSLISAVGKAEEQYGYASAPALTASQKVIIERLADSKVEMSATQMEQAMLALNQLIANSLGYFTTTVESGGAKTTYIHDKSTLASSDIIYVLTGSGFAWTDTGWNGGNPTWQYGLSGTGNAVLKVLSAYGINAEWINTGTLNAARVSIGSGTTFASGYDPTQIEVGARNLIVRSTETANLVINNSGGLSARTDHAVTDYIKITPSTNYVASKITSVLSSDNHFRIGWYDIDKVFVERIYSTDNTFFMTSPATAEYMRISYPTDSRPKLEKGNKPTDWTPAPEDVDQSIATVQENVDTLSDSLGDLAYLDLVEKAKLGTTVINGGYLVTDLIEADSITSSKLNVLAKSLVNNYSRTGVLIGWSTSDGSIVVDPDLNAPVHRVTTTTNRTIRSDYFEVDPTKTYKVTLSIKCEDTDGARHFGLWAYDKDSTNIAVTPFGGGSQTFGTPTTNFYFRSYAGSTNGWLHMEAYILGCNITDKSEIPIGKNITQHCRMPANCSQIRLRYLNYGTAGTTRTAYFFSPTVTPVDSGTIRAENIVAGTIDAGLVNIVTGTGTSKVEITGTGIDGYLNDILRVQLEYDRLEFHRAGSAIGNIRTEYVNLYYQGSILGDCIFVEAAGNAIAFNAASGSTDPSLVVFPTWCEIPALASASIGLATYKDTSQWTISTESKDLTFYIEHTLGKRIAFTSAGHLTVDTYHIQDCRTMSGSDGSSSYYPLPQALASYSMQAIFSYFDDGLSWRTAIFLHGWHASYAAWRLSGPASTTADDNFYLQSGVNGAWRTKCKIWHDQNDGSGSGLDADTLESYHGSSSSTALTYVLRDSNKYISVSRIGGNDVSPSYGVDLGTTDTANCYIRCRRIGANTTPNSIYTIDAGKSWIRGGRLYFNSTGSGYIGGTALFAVDIHAASGEDYYLGFEPNAYRELSIYPSGTNKGDIGVSSSSSYLYRGYATSWNSVSSVANKCNIIKGDTEEYYELAKLVDVYLYSSDADKKDLRFGLLAEQAPIELVGMDTKTKEGSGIDLYAFTTFNFAVIKELQKRIEELQAEVGALKNGIG